MMAFPAQLVTICCAHVLLGVCALARANPKQVAVLAGAADERVGGGASSAGVG